MNARELAERQAAEDAKLLEQLRKRSANRAGKTLLARAFDRAKANIAALRNPPDPRERAKAVRAAVLAKRHETPVHRAATKAPFSREHRRRRNRIASHSRARNRA